MKEDRFDRLLRGQLKRETAQIGVSDFLKTRIDMEITARQEEAKHMKKNVYFKRYIAVAACLCLMVPAGIFAGGMVGSYTSSTNPADSHMSSDWDDLDRMEEKTGIVTDAVEDFSNGYRYSTIATRSFDARDEDGNKMFTVKELDVTYENAAGNVLECSMHRADERIRENRAADMTGEYDGVTVSLYQDTYKFVPAEYEKTAEDRAMEAEGTYTISYGNDTVEYKEVTSALWEKDDVSYMLQGFDTELTPQEMLAMAEEMIED